MKETFSTVKAIAVMLVVTGLAAAVQVYVSEKVRKHVNKEDKKKVS